MFYPQLKSVVCSLVQEQLYGSGDPIMGMAVVAMVVVGLFVALIVRLVRYAE